MENHPGSGLTPQDQSPLRFMQQVDRLKHVPRTGWLRFLKNPESVASHSFGVALLGGFAPVSLSFYALQYLT